MSAARATWSAAAVLALLLAVACRPAGACKPGQPFCWCPAGQSCAQDCAGAPGCALDCANGNGSCTLAGGDRCTAACQNARECRATCGRESTVACQHVSGACHATVGEGSRVHCEQAAGCDVTCAGACAVDCPGGRCLVRCAPGAACTLACDGPVTGCPDGRTRACGEACPG